MNIQQSVKWLRTRNSSQTWSTILTSIHDPLAPTRRLPRRGAITNQQLILTFVYHRNTTSYLSYFILCLFNLYKNKVVPPHWDL